MRIPGVGAHLRICGVVRYQGCPRTLVARPARRTLRIAPVENISSRGGGKKPGTALYTCVTPNRTRSAVGSSQNGTQPPEILTVKEIADTLRLNPQTIRNWISRGTLPALRLGRRVRILRCDFESFIEKSRVEPESSPVQGDVGNDSSQASVRAYLKRHRHPDWHAGAGHAVISILDSERRRNGFKGPLGSLSAPPFVASSYAEQCALASTESEKYGPN